MGALVMPLCSAWMLCPPLHSTLMSLHLADLSSNISALIRPRASLLQLSSHGYTWECVCGFPSLGWSLLCSALCCMKEGPHWCFPFTAGFTVPLRSGCSNFGDQMKQEVMKRLNLVDSPDVGRVQPGVSSAGPYRRIVWGCSCCRRSGWGLSPR